MMLPLLLYSNSGSGAVRALANASVNKLCLLTSSYSTQQPPATRPPLPPFDEQTALQKVKMAEAAWNTRDPDKVALAYTEDSEWRNRAEFIQGRDAIREFLRRKWAREQDYKLRKYLWAFKDNRISVCFEYEYRDGSGHWWRAYGNENWEFSAEGLMRKRIASINESKIREDQRRIAVDEGAVVHNSWLQEQGLSDVTAGGDFPLGGGSSTCY
ncbi:hypothetical protein OEZ85_007641 [Tetradesmus obliquus]|uniref:SnoaL-like domain-containing protein n=1 Tax=Tetradesmus obliquus TaxID=3088 RepID=A0ABY8TGJ3_TETOB|nr:hypothetical protein OEZ85_007641 [Tetradesmus obliquus]